MTVLLERHHNERERESTAIQPLRILTRNGHGHACYHAHMLQLSGSFDRKRTEKISETRHNILLCYFFSFVLIGGSKQQPFVLGVKSSGNNSSRHLARNK